MTGPRLDPDDLAAVERIMAPADEALARGYPGDAGTRQPVHTVYLPADRVVPGIVHLYGEAARAAGGPAHRPRGRLPRALRRRGGRGRGGRGRHARR